MTRREQNPRLKKTSGKIEDRDAVFGGKGHDNLNGGVNVGGGAGPGRGEVWENETGVTLILRKRKAWTWENKKTHGG